MDVIIYTSDPAAIPAAAVAKVLEAAGWFVLSVTVEPRETVNAGSSWEHPLHRAEVEL